MVRYADDFVIVEMMPEYLHGTHREAGNWGTYPHNGAKRKIMTREEADYPDDEVASVLKQAKDRIMSSIDDDGLNICEFILKDSNGNTIGNVRIEAD